MLDLYRVNDNNFDSIALSLFRFQAVNNPVYRDYLKYLSVDIRTVTTVNEIPFLPITFFKNHEIKTGSWQEQTSFTSSSTTGMIPGRHFIHNIDFYLQHARKCFEYFFDSLEKYHFFALLPAYLERQQSSLVSMIDYFIRASGSPFSGFYLYEHDKLLKDIQQARQQQPQRIPLLWGVSFALLDLAEGHHPDLHDCLVFETGGMKGRRKEITRDELHTVLKKSFHVNTVYSEYGMTELLSQAYTRGGKKFFTPPWMKILIRDVADPFMVLQPEKSGAIQVIDLANWATIAFVETEDSGKVMADCSFEVMGRLDNSDVRGCNLMVE